MSNALLEKITKYSSFICIACSTICVIACLVVVLSGRGGNNSGGSEDVAKAVKTGIDSIIAPIRRENEALQKSNDSLRLDVANLKASDTVFVNTLNKNSQVITALNKRYNEKISAVDKFNATDVDLFISERYGHQ